MVQCINQQDYRLVNHAHCPIIEDEIKELLQQQASLGNFIHFHTLQSKLQKTRYTELYSNFRDSDQFIQLSFSRLVFAALIGKY